MSTAPDEASGLRVSSRDSLWIDALKEGWSATKINAPAGLLVFGMTLVLVISYYRLPFVTRALDWLMVVKIQGGLWFAFAASGLAGGVLSEVYTVYAMQKSRWTKSNLQSAVFKFGLFGVGGMIVNGLYAGQATLFGETLSWQVVVPKVLVDQFVFNPLWACPFQAMMLYFLHQGFGLGQVRYAFSARFYARHILPVLVTNWFVWIPLVSCIYSLPVALQLPVNIAAGMFWSLMLTSLSVRAAQAHAPQLSMVGES